MKHLIKYNELFGLFNKKIKQEDIDQVSDLFLEYSDSFNLKEVITSDGRDGFSNQMGDYDESEFTIYGVGTNKDESYKSIHIDIKLSYMDMDSDIMKILKSQINTFIKRLKKFNFKSKTLFDWRDPESYGDYAPRTYEDNLFGRITITKS